MNGIEKVTFAYGITSIGDSAFENNSIKNIEISSSVRYIGQKAFYLNPLDTVRMLTMNATIMDDAFSSERAKVIIYGMENDISIEGYVAGDQEKYTYEVLKLITSCTVTPIPTQYYSGTLLTPTFEIKDGDKTLVEGTDYETMGYYYNNEIGDAIIHISGLGKYYDAKSLGFKIEKQQYSVTINSPEGATITSVLVNGVETTLVDNKLTISNPTENTTIEVKAKKN